MYNRWLSPPNELYHHGVKGMKWGVRRFQPYSQVPRGSGKGGKEIGQAKKGTIVDAVKKKMFFSKDGTLNERGKKNYKTTDNSLSYEELELKKKDPKAFERQMLKECDFRNIPDKSIKASKELEVLSDWSSDDWESLPLRRQERTVALFKQVRDHSYDGYNAKAHSPSQMIHQKEHDKAWADYDTKEQKIFDKYRPEAERLEKTYNLLGTDRAFKKYYELKSKMWDEIKPLEAERNKKVHAINRRAAIQALKDVGYEVNDKSIQQMLYMIETD